jgi:hypothetical protein
MFEQDVTSWKENASHPGNDVAKYKRLLAKAAPLKPLLESNPDEFKHGYVLLKSIEAGGPETYEALQAAASKGNKEEQQRKYEDYKLQTVVKKKLTAFLAVAKTVDFSAQTTTTGGRQRFTNPAYEGKDANWKLLYRAGKAPTTAAIQIAEQWLREL